MNADMRLNNNWMPPNIQLTPTIGMINKIKIGNISNKLNFNFIPVIIEIPKSTTII